MHFLVVPLLETSFLDNLICPFTNTTPAVGMRCCRDKLSYQNNTQILEIHPSRLSENDFRHLSEEEGTCHGRICSGDQWIVIDVDDWFKSGAEKETERMFTLRISWPASVRSSHFQIVPSLTSS